MASPATDRMFIKSVAHRKAKYVAAIVLQPQSNSRLSLGCGISQTSYYFCIRYGTGRSFEETGTIDMTWCHTSHVVDNVLTPP